MSLVIRLLLRGPSRDVSQVQEAIEVGHFFLPFFVDFFIIFFFMSYHPLSDHAKS